MYFGHIVDNKGDIIDEVTLVEMPEGKSYTGQKQTEIFCHGGQFVLRRILREILKLGIRAAEPGEFTRRAFLSGRIDLARAEAVADLIGSKTEFSYMAAKNNLLGTMSEGIEAIRRKSIDLLAEIEASVDYPEEDIEMRARDKMLAEMNYIIKEAKGLISTYRSGRIIREGYKIAIAGRPNAGKSSLFNILLNQNRAIVAPIPGTTRDYLTEWIDLGGVPVALTDTAGLRRSSGHIEREGQKSARTVLENADLVLWLVDISSRNWQKDLVGDLKRLSPNKDIILLYNKIDKLKHRSKLPVDEKNGNTKQVTISCRTKIGLQRLRKELTDHINGSMPDLTDQLVVTSERHKRKLELAVKFFRRTAGGIRESLSPELVAFEMRQGINEIDEITGRIYNEEILDRIFARFCIGK
ncbi:tRNA modification GTPase MnmE [Candidatus Zixiibacteriota bacterium]|nr:tRNA modification GTPase MnmE [candidate division Zixibacteria bacterium]